MTLEHTMVRRLAFVKYLYSNALKQSKAPAPLNAASILGMHDAAEFFLGLACEHLNTGKTDFAFMDYWEIINKKLASSELQQKVAMGRLNKARVALKHHGALPSSLNIEAHRATITNFFQDNVPLVFEKTLDEISLVEFVNPESARQKLKLAQEFIQKEEIKPALENVAAAFEEMIYDYEARKREFYRSPYFFGEEMTFLSSFHMDLDESMTGSGRLSEFVDKVKESIEEIQSAIKILALGIDYRKYAKFKQIVPSVSRVINGHISIWWHRSAEGLTIEDVNFGIDFVIEASLALSDFDYTVEKTDVTWPTQENSQTD